MAFVATHVTIASPHAAALNVLSYSSAGKWSWKKAVSCEGGKGGAPITVSIWMFLFLPVALLENDMTPSHINTVPCRRSYYPLCSDYMIQRLFFIDDLFSLQVRLVILPASNGKPEHCTIWHSASPRQRTNNRHLLLQLLWAISAPLQLAPTETSGVCR